MNQRFSWSTIENFFGGEWVELIDFDWSWEKAKPTSARVRCHAENRGELLAQIKEIGPRADAVVLYVAPAATMVQHVSGLAA